MAGSLSSATVKFALPWASVCGRSSSSWRTAVDVIVGQAESIAGEAGALLGGADHDFAFKLETRCRRAIEEMSVDADCGRRVRGIAAALLRQIELQPIGHIVLDHEGGFANRRALWDR